MSLLKAAFFIKNVPAWERAARVSAGLALALGGYIAWASPWRWVGVGLGLEVLLTGFVGFCPVCALAGRRLDKLR